MKPALSRRQFVQSALLASGAAALHAADQAPGSAAVGSGAKPQLPMGKIGNLQLSRLMLGGNLISGYAHSRDLPYVAHLMKRYNSEAKIRETLELAELNGVNSVNLTVWDDNSFLQKHWKGGGQIKWIAQALPGNDGNLDQFKKGVDMGAAAIHLQGHGSETLYEAGKVDEIGKIVEVIRSQGVPAGVAAHCLDVIVACEKAKLPVDFYVKTLHTHDYHSAPKAGETGYLGRYDNSWCNNPEEVVEFMATVKKPWVAFKVMAAGAIAPQRAFQFAFDSGADFVLAGMFDWQVAEDVQIAKRALAGTSRSRPWCA
jgi:hypothetical protein